MPAWHPSLTWLDIQLDVQPAIQAVWNNYSIQAVWNNYIIQEVWNNLPARLESSFMRLSSLAVSLKSSLMRLSSLTVSLTSSLMRLSSLAVRLTSSLMRLASLAVSLTSSLKRLATVLTSRLPVSSLQWWDYPALHQGWYRIQLDVVIQLDIKHFIQFKIESRFSSSLKSYLIY